MMRKCRGCVRTHTLLLRGVRSPAPLTYICAPFRVCQARTKTSKPWRLARLNHEYSPWSGSWMPPTTYYFDNGSRMGFSEFWWTSGHDGSCLDVFQDQAATHETLFRVVLETRGSDAPHPWTFRAMLESGPAMPLRKCLELLHNRCGEDLRNGTHHRVGWVTLHHLQIDDKVPELVRQLANAAKSIGNHELQTKFEKGSELLKRDIVFCSSLYL